MSTVADPVPTLDEKQHDSPPTSTNNSLPDTTKSSNTHGTLEKDPEAFEQPASPRRVKGIAWAFVVVAILSSTFLFALDNTIVADVQPTIVRQFGSVNKLTWLSVGFLLGSTTTNLLWGQIYTQFDAKWVYILCVTLFEAGSALCGAAPNMGALIIGRVICGMGGGGMYTGVMVLLSANTTEQERPSYFGLTGISWGAGTCLGPIIGGALSNSSATWRWAFYINLCVGAACAPVYLFLLPRADPTPGAPLKARLSKIDFLGALLICGTFLCGLMAISFGGTVYAWSSGSIIALFVLFPVLMSIFLIQQFLCIATTTETRLWPVEFLTNPFMVNMFLQVAGATTGVFIPIYFIPLYFSFVEGDGALQSGVRLLSYVIPMVVICVVNGYSMSYFGYYTPWFIFGATFTLIGSALLYTIDTNTSNAHVYAYSALGGLGSGAYIQATFSVAQLKAPKELAKYVVGFLTNAQLAGPAFALSIANAAFLNEATESLQKILPAASKSQIQLVIDGAGSDVVDSLSAGTKQMVTGAIVKALDKPFVVSLTAGALTLLLALCLKWEKLFVKVGEGEGRSDGCREME